MNFINSLQSEWMKTRRSAASWLCIIGASFLPVLFIVSFLKDHSTINDIHGQQNVWKIYFFQIWRFMAMAILPFGVILSSTLIAQIEYRNNTWKQLHTTPQSLTTIFTAKLLAIILMVVKFFIIFNIGILLSAIIPSLLFRHGLPTAAFPFYFFMEINLKIFISCLPVIAIQFLLSLQFKNFLIPVGVGLLLLVGSIILIFGWKYAYLSPYSYTILLVTGDKTKPLPVNIYAFSAGYFILGVVISYYLYLSKKDKS
ncbi:hypothetical protein F0919_00245 [Taibaiella lutea]|uniref:ABC transporter permease n=1 Tax=Taibaiella lutea TaxID=2608001 RepID=A0A5M6CMA1_9BACT|nr:ABC transporter permease [Taibaiella lutea]KAA5536136.1 hypothetical protein F0919_00245 [Taibaiella lutea]